MYHVSLFGELTSHNKSNYQMFYEYTKVRTTPYAEASTCENVT